VALELLKPFLGLGANFTYPRLGAVLQLRMILILPGPRGVAKSLALAANHDLATGNFGKKRTSSPLADQFVDIGNQIDRKNNVGSAV
jgi:hypothetical protein